MTTEDIFRRIAAALAEAGIPYMLTGSFASSYHGIPRATQDIDPEECSSTAGTNGLAVGAQSAQRNSPYPRRRRGNAWTSNPEQFSPSAFPA